MPSAAESLLAAGAYEPAREAARRLTRVHPSDPQGFHLLGRALAGGPSPRLLEAVRAFREAARLAPRDTIAWRGTADAALRLGGADGERLARDALERLLALDPARPWAWEQYLGSYRSSGDRVRMRRLLQPQADNPRVAVRIAALLIEDEHYGPANATLDRVLTSEPENATALALRAQSAFEAGEDSAGFAFYERALKVADRDPGPLWQQAVGIATPEELRAWAGGPHDPEQFLRAFWARRQTNLFQGVNARIAEHFHRLRVARARWPLQHPLVNYQQRTAARWLNAAPSAAEELFFQRCEVRGFVGGPGNVRDAARLGNLPRGVLPDRFETFQDRPYTDFVPEPGVLVGFGKIVEGGVTFPPAAPFAELGRYGRSLLNVDSSALATGYGQRTGLDDRGLVYLRLGQPANLRIGPPNTEDPFCTIRDLELWDYGALGTVRFFRPSAVSVFGAGESSRQTGDIVLRPMNDAQLTAMARAVTKDSTSVPAPLSFGAWFVQLRGAEPGQTTVVVATTRGAAAAELVPEDGEPGLTSRSADGVVTINVRPGRGKLLVHAQVADTLGRQTLPLTVRSFARTPATSDLLVAHPWGDTLVTRGALIAALSRDLTFAVGSQLRTAVELYGLRPEPDGRVRYEVAYWLVGSREPTRQMREDSLGRPTVLSYARERPAGGDVASEWLDIGTAGLEPGRYLLRVDLLAGGRRIGRAQAVIRLTPATRR